MKIYIFTDEQGKILGTYPLSSTETKEGIHLMPQQSIQKGQQVHEVDVPQELVLRAEKSLEDFYKELDKLIKQK